MKRTAAFALIAMLACAVLMAAQNPPEMQKPGPEVKKLGYFAGTWKLDGDMKASPFGPAGKFTGTEHNQWMPGGFFLISHADEKTPMGPGTGLAVFGYDPNEKVYTYNAFNSMGQAEHAKGTVEGDIWTWNDENKMGDKIMRGRFTVKTTSPTAYTFKFEMAPEGGDFSTIMEGKATKEATAAKKK